MDEKKQAQAAWAVLLALLALLFLPGTPNLPRNGNPSETPAEDPAPDDQPNSDEQPNEDGAEDGTENPSGDGTGDGWLPPDEDPRDGPHDGHGHEAPEGVGDGTGWGAGDPDPMPGDPTSEYPTPDDNGAPRGGPSGSTQPDNPANENVYGHDDIAEDLRGRRDSWPELLTAVDDPVVERIEGAAAVLSLPAVQLYNQLKDPVTSTAHDTVQFALEHPRQSAIVVGAVAGATILVVADGPLPVGDSAAVALVGSNVPQFQSIDAAKQHVESVGNAPSATTPGGRPRGPGVGVGGDIDSSGDSDAGGSSTDGPNDGSGHEAAVPVPEPDDNIGWEAPDDYSPPEDDTSSDSDSDDELVTDGPNDGHGHEAWPVGGFY